MRLTVSPLTLTKLLTNIVIRSLDEQLLFDPKKEVVHKNKI